MSGFKKLLASKRFWTAVITLGVLVAVNVLGVDEDMAVKIEAAVMKLGAFLIGGMSLSDTAMALKGKKTE
jgi:hypothetical protein